MIGTWVNVMAIICGSLLGIVLKKGLPDKIKEITMQAIGLGVVLVGLKMAFVSENLVIVLLSMAFGAAVGEWMNIEGFLEKVGKLLEDKLSALGNGKSSIARGFVAATLLYCVGAMAITGALQSGLTGDHSTLYAKSVLDGITAIILTTTLGIGVIFSSLAVLFYQGTITLLAGIMQNIISDVVITEVTATGGLLILAIGLGLLEIKKIKVGNLLPALLFVVILAEIAQKLNELISIF
ncbi:MAG: uncharacterized protein PWQ96_23 [Clostridia bacterium]|nr:hypothetical protein [Clostridiales bacterium]MDK2984381.1 uncharacterized protein [Clostridia bacterium]